MSLNPLEEKQEEEENEGEDDADPIDVGGGDLEKPPYNSVEAARQVYATVLYADAYAGKTWKAMPPPSAPVPPIDPTAPSIASNASPPVLSNFLVREPKNVLSEVMRMNIHFRAQKGTCARQPHHGASAKMYAIMMHDIICVCHRSIGVQSFCMDEQSPPRW